MRKELDLWLGASWTNDVYDNLIQKRLDGTCDWILSRQAFLDWISPDFPSGTSKILWINGPAGHGKTILCARVVQYLSTMLESPLAYYFCSSESETRRDSLTIMRSWVSQIISGNRDAFELACGKWETKDRRDASQSDIVDLFRTIIQHISNCTFVVDGLDECAWAAEKWKSDIGQSPKGFFESIKSAVANTTTRILILSRDEPEIRHSLRAVIAGDNYQDLNEYQICPDDVRPDTTLFSRSIIDNKLANKSETLKNELSQRMADRCEGMFLWVKMLEDQLRGGKNKKQLEETIDQTPTALSHLYDRNWIKISHFPEEDKLRAFSILRWAAFALRPLTILEITEALIVDDDAEDLSIDELPEAIDEYYISTEIQGLCGSLLETRKAAEKQDLGSMTIHLAHFSVKQYILCNLPVQGELIVNERLRVSSETFQSNILAKLCLRYLNYQIVWREPLQLQSDLDRRPFRNYAAGSWYYHATERGSNCREVIKLANALFSSNNGNWESWKKWFDANDDKSKMPESQRAITSTNPLFYASLLGLRDTVIYLLEEEKVGVNQVDEFKRTAVQAAALKGQTSIVKLLLEKGADVTVGNREGWTPLNSASDSGHVEVVKLLLEKGADITVATERGWTPLNSASSNGHVEVVKLLLEKGADITVATKRGWTPLNSASDRRHVEVVKLLLEKGADMAVADQDGWTPLNTASSSGHVEVVKLLLDKGADMAVADQDGWTPLNTASSSGHVEVVKLLLNKGADIATANQDGWTPLNLASSKGHVEVVKLLLDKGADLTVKSNQGWTPLNTASSNGHVKVVKLLLEKGADITAATNQGWTPLNLASNSGHVEVVKLLLDKGADLRAATNQGWTPLNSASSNGHVEVVKLLLEKGADITVANQGWTPLNLASNNGHVEVVKLLLEKGADLTAATNQGWTPLNAASENGHVEVVKLLLNKVADIATANQDGWTPLNLASSKGHIEVVKLLLNKGADIATANQDGWTPLNLASNNGHVEVVKLLLDKGADLTVKSNQGWTPLNAASESGHVEVVKLLLENGANVTVVHQGGWTPLHSASKRGHIDVVKLLLNIGQIDFDAKDLYGRTPLLYAARNGNEAAVQLLLATNRVNIDSKDYYGSTPLSIAARIGNKDVVAFLLTKSHTLNVKDAFGRSPLWWARKNGYPEIADLLLEKYKENSITIQEDDLPTPTVSVPADKESGYCDVCVLDISDTDICYFCKVCSNGDFWICEECLAIGAHCLDKSHTLIKK